MFERTELIPKGLLIAVLIGLVSGPIAGAILYLQDDNQQLIFVEGPSVSIVTEKIDFKLKEEIVIKIVNSGTVPLTFNDASYGLRVTGLDGILYYTPVAAQVVSKLESKDEISQERSNKALERAKVRLKDKSMDQTRVNLSFCTIFFKGRL